MADEDVVLSHEAAERIAQRFRALGDPNRLVILDHLARHGEVGVSDLGKVIGGSQQNVSKHMGVLWTERFVARRKDGTRTLYRLAKTGLPELVAAVASE